MNRHPAITLLIVAAIVAAVFIVHSIFKTIAAGTAAVLGLPGALWQGLKDDVSAASSAVSGFVTGDSAPLTAPLPFTFAVGSPVAAQPVINSVFSGAPTDALGFQNGYGFNP